MTMIIRYDFIATLFTNLILNKYKADKAFPTVTGIQGKLFHNWNIEFNTKLTQISEVNTKTSISCLKIQINSRFPLICTKSLTISSNLKLKVFQRGMFVINNISRNSIRLVVHFARCQEYLNSYFRCSFATIWAELDRFISVLRVHHSISWGGARSDRVPASTMRVTVESLPKRYRNCNLTLH